MKKRILAGLALAAMAALLLCGCTRSTYTQEDIGEPPATIDGSGMHVSPLRLSFLDSCRRDKGTRVI